jgi:hypothetical protein
VAAQKLAASSLLKGVICRYSAVGGARRRPLLAIHGPNGAKVVVSQVGFAGKDKTLVAEVGKGDCRVKMSFKFFRLRLVRLLYCLCEIVLQERKTNLGCGLLRGYPSAWKFAESLSETQMASPTNSIKVSEVQHRGEQARGILSDFTHSLYAVFQTKQ